MPARTFVTLIRRCAFARIPAQRDSKSKFLISSSRQRNVARSDTFLRNTSVIREEHDDQRQARQDAKKRRKDESTNGHE
jgi:hypothetical protein